MWGFGSLKDVLDVVMVPLVISLLTPWITRRWQDRERDVRIKTELVTEISDLVMKAVMTTHLSRIPLGPWSENAPVQQQELENVYRLWRIQTCVIGSKLHAYFPDKDLGQNQIHKRWNRFSEDITRYVENQNETRNGVAAEVEKKEALLEEKATIIESILASPITAFRDEHGKLDGVS